MTLGQVTTKFPVAGRYRVEYSGGFGGSCSASPCDYSIGSYIDGQPVSGSRLDDELTIGAISIPCGAVASKPYDRAITVPAGTHTVEVALKNETNASMTSSCNPHLTVTGPHS